MGQWDGLRAKLPVAAARPLGRLARKQERQMSFDTKIDRFGTHSVKWDMMESLYGVPAKGGIPMWVADMDFRPPECVQTALQRMLDQGIYGYFAGDEDYRAAICWWMAERHGWTLAPGAIFTWAKRGPGAGAASASSSARSSVRSTVA